MVINNNADEARFEKDLHGLKSAVDWRDILAWREDPAETKVLAEIARSLDADDITNLIFTRYALLCVHVCPMMSALIRA